MKAKEREIFNRVDNYLSPTINEEQIMSIPYPDVKIWAKGKDRWFLDIADKCKNHSEVEEYFNTDEKRKSLETFTDITEIRHWYVKLRRNAWIFLGVVSLGMFQDVLSAVIIITMLLVIAPIVGVIHGHCTKKIRVYDYALLVWYIEELKIRSTISENQEEIVSSDN